MVNFTSWHNSAPQTCTLCIQGMGTEQSPVVSPAMQPWDRRTEIHTWKGWKMGHHLVTSVCIWLEHMESWNKDAKMRIWRAGRLVSNTKVFVSFISFCKHTWSKHSLVDMRPCALSLCTEDNFLLIGIISLLDIADGISATKGWCMGDLVRWMEGLVVHTCRGENVEHAWKYSSLLWFLSWE